jgi:coenzyme F420-reducing hydrogenase alpha subunit
MAVAMVPLLPTPLQATALAELAKTDDTDPEFARRPVWRGAPAETGALAKLQSDALLQALMQRGHSRVPARFVARLRELALLLAGRSDTALGATALPDGSALAWVENARGLLLHRLRLVQGRTAGYRIVAPTEWNFHPEGALPAALRDAPAHDLESLRRRTRVLVDSLDPCVACSVEIEDA